MGQEFAYKAEIPLKPNKQHIGLFRKRLTMFNIYRVFLNVHTNNHCPIEIELLGFLLPHVWTNPYAHSSHYGHISSQFG